MKKSCILVLFFTLSCISDNKLENIENQAKSLKSWINPNNLNSSIIIPSENFSMLLTTDDIDLQAKILCQKCTDSDFINIAILLNFFAKTNNEELKKIKNSENTNSEIEKMLKNLKEKFSYVFEKYEENLAQNIKNALMILPSYLNPNEFTLNDNEVQNSTYTLFELENENNMESNLININDNQNLALKETLEILIPKNNELKSNSYIQYKKISQKQAMKVLKTFHPIFDHYLDTIKLTSCLVSISKNLKIFSAILIVISAAIVLILKYGYNII